ncbi:Aflatoxin biosynthesis regulatory protein [Penicillium waksmanii]|uniref:Aflatoxin biosynthesis regulatory protein n=1 Tax=Penicillium waksmanii TaxID=69791 RepID=UPI00254918EE|nr:Aflatoxin biosynthesis regulatory protein [Penicillium waksmanii]KAJ6000219.1 Aflatoxin biosynthesis regulatory protein [Penicillium waksmanii]
MRRVKKSRNGCSRCKTKRVRIFSHLGRLALVRWGVLANADPQVKCGEEKPHCNRCSRLGVRCPGYVQSLKWVTKYEEPSPGASSDGKALSPAPPQISPKQPSHSTEQLLPTDDPIGGTSHNLESSEFGLDESNPLCDHLWDLPGNGSLPELSDLCPSPIPTSSAFQQSHQAVDDFISSAENAIDLSHFLSLIGPTNTDEEGGGGGRGRVRHYPPAPQRSTSRDFMSISRPLNNPSWTLIEYYFKEVAALFSSYDSQMNPFRTTVSRLWGSSLAMCRTMQSMAAATLVNDFPQFGPLGRKMRDEAVEIITREAVMDDKALLALLMLGQTASWHDPQDLGISFFNLLRQQLTTIGSSTTPDFGFVKSTSNNYRFFEEALIYWEMLLSFVADTDMVSSDSHPSSMDEPLVLQRVPHPWTGIARDTQFTVHEVGRLVRRERQRVRARRFTSQEEIARAQIAIEKARELEERLLALAHPTEAEIVSPGDDETPVWHLLTMAEVYRCTGLMQLYRVFPDLLRNRLPNSSSSSSSSPTSARDPFFPVDLDNTEPNNSETLYNNWLTEFAITTLSRLKTIPLESRTRCLQPFLLVAASSELRLPRSTSHLPQTSHDTPQSRTRTRSQHQPQHQPQHQNHHQTPDDLENDHTNDSEDTEQPSISMEAIEISRTRRFILGRLTSFLHVLPPKPINVCLRLVREVWKRMDAGETDAYWIDVMIEKGWETTMG